MAVLVPEGTEVLAGLEMGGIAVVTAVARHAKLPTAFIRKQPSSTERPGSPRVRGGRRRVLVVETWSPPAARSSSRRMSCASSARTWTTRSA